MRDSDAAAAPSTAAIAAAVLEAAAAGRSIPPFTDADPGLDLARAYRVGAEVARQREAAGERTAGWKIGFTNIRMWDEYGVRAPIWAPIYDRTLVAVEDASAAISCSLAGLAEPRIEPEVVLRFARAPEPGADEDGILACVDAVAFGFEIVQSLYPGWRFRAPDTVAGFGLHGRLYCGPLMPTTPDAGTGWREKLGAFRVTLDRDGRRVDEGSAANVLGGPLQACRRFLDGLAADGSFPRGVRAGDLVTTGTVTRAFPVAAGETWDAAVSGLGLPGLRIAFA